MSDNPTQLLRRKVLAVLPRVRLDHIAQCSGNKAPHLDSREIVTDWMVLRWNVVTNDRVTAWLRENLA